MLSFLCSLTFAAALEPGSHVLVKTGAALSRPGGAWSAVPTSADVAWPATVVADRGDVLEVRLSEDGCATPLGSARLLGVTFSVRKADLQPMVSHAARGTDTFGNAWFVGAGAPVVGHGDPVVVAAAPGVQLAVPGAPIAVAAWVAAPSAQPRSEGAWGSVQIAGKTGGLSTTEARLGVSTESDGRLTWTGRCASYTFASSFPAEGIDADLANLNSAKVSLPAGTALFWPDGAKAGSLRGGVSPASYEDTGELRCFKVPLSDERGGPAVPLCARADQAPPPESATMAGAASPALTSDPIILGTLDKSLIDAVIKRNANQIRYCYQRELTQNPKLEGKLTVKFVIAKDGSVSSATIKSTTLANPAVEDCVTGRFMRFQFPEPMGGGIVIVSYPFVFAPG